MIQWINVNSFAIIQWINVNLFAMIQWINFRYFLCSWFIDCTNFISFAFTFEFERFDLFLTSTWNLLNICSTCYSKINRTSLLSYDINANFCRKFSLFWRQFSKSRDCKSCCTNFNSHNCSRNNLLSRWISRERYIEL